MSLDEYNRKRNFKETPEPSGQAIQGNGPLHFVVQMHQATRLHYDFRIEVDGVLKSWAVPKGPSLNAQDQRLAVFVEDHPLAYREFEGIIPKGNYGAGTVMVWDEGTYLERNSASRGESESAVLKGLELGHITLLLEGHKLRGEFALIRIKEGDPKSWLLIKKRDEYASYTDITRENRSIKTGRSIEEITLQAPGQGAIWLTASVLPQKKTIPPPGQPPANPSSDPVFPERFPRKNKPMLPILGKHAFDQEGWIFEIEFGGYRALAELESGSVRLYSRQLIPFENKFKIIAESLSRAKINAVLDGEVVKTAEGEFTYWVRDLLHLNGMNLRNLPLVERKNRLHQLQIFDRVIRYCPHVDNTGLAVFDQALKDGNPGILAKDAYSPYRAGISKKWLRISTESSKSEKSEPRLSHLDKIYWPDEKLTKGDLIEYYRRIAPTLLPYLKDRPESLHRHPDGIRGESFFQKDLVGYHPRWLKTERIFSDSAGRSIDYLVCQNEKTLLYMANLGCIELNPWLSRIGSPDQPDFAVIDLDPDGNEFAEVVEIALQIHEILTKVGAAHLCKTSGATGLHIYIPLQSQYDYDLARKFALAISQAVHQNNLTNTSLERTPAKRRGKIYLDCFQNAKGQTVASVYSARPRPKAPVSTPLRWDELNSNLNPESFTIKTVPDRLERLGDLWLPILTEKVDIQSCLSILASKYPISPS